MVHQTFIFPPMISCKGKIKLVTQLGSCPTFQPLQYTSDIQYCTGRAPWQPPRTHYGYTAAVSEWQMNSLAFSVVNGVKQRRTAALFSLRDPHCAPLQQCLSSRRHIHMVGLYSSLRPLTCRAPVGTQARCNHDGSHPALPPLQTFIIIVTLGPRYAPIGPQTFPRRMFPRGSAKLQLVRFAVMHACMSTVVFVRAL